MKTLPFIILLVLCATFFPASSQSLYEVSLDEKVVHSTLIVEGKVVEQQSFWNDRHTMIFTSHKVEVYKVFKGNTSTSFIEVMTVGGTVGNDNVTASDLLELSKDEVGIFFTYPNSIGLNSPATGKQLMDIYSSGQGFFKYDVTTLGASAPFVRYASVENDLYTILEQKTGNRFREIKSFRVSQLRPESQPGARTAAINDFTPTTVNAGAILDPTNNLLTINGSGFGTASGAAAILFDDANNGTGGAAFVVPFNDPLVVSWGATQIQVRVPSRAGTGTFQVRDDAGTLANSPTPLQIRYSILTATFSAGTVTKESNLMNTNGAGGYDVFYSTNTAGGALDFNAAPEKNTFQRALTTWRENNGVNFREAGTTTVQAVAADGFNTIMFDNTNTGTPVLASGVLAVCFSFNSMCTPTTTNQPQKINWDVVLRNAGVSAGTANFTAGPCPPASSNLAHIDLETVLLHELGHAINLGHINDGFQGSFVPNINPSKLMHFAVVNSVRRTSPDLAAHAGANYAVAPSSNTYGSCALFTAEMVPLTAVIESKDNCPVFPSTSTPARTVVPFDLVHATSNMLVDPQFTAVNCSGTGVGVTNTAYYVIKTSAAGDLVLTVSDYSTRPGALASCTPVAPYPAAAGIELALYAVSSCPAGQSFPAPLAGSCRTFNGNGALAAINGLAANTTYLLVADGIENTKAVFNLQFDGSSLPLRLSSFTGRIAGDYNELKWTLEYTTDIKRLVLERSADGVSYASLYEIENNIPRDNIYNDIRPFSADNYYRLAIENTDGTIDYSTVVHLVRDDKFLAVVYPNPAIGTINIQVSTDENRKVVFDLYNNIGQLVHRQSNDLLRGGQFVSLPAGRLAKGTYFLKISDENKNLLKKIYVLIQ